MVLYLVIFALLAGLVSFILLFALSGRARPKHPLWRICALVLLILSGVGFVTGIRQAVSSCAQGRYTNVSTPLAPSTILLSGQDSPTRVTALNARDGALRWQHNLAPGDLSGTGLLTVSHDVVYVLGQENTSSQQLTTLTNGGLTAYRARDGRLLWHASLPGSTSSSLFEINEAPLLADGMVYVGATASPGQSLGKIYAFHMTDGTLGWSVQVTPYPYNQQNRSLAAGSGLLFLSTFAGGIGHVMAFRAQDGHQVWQAGVGSMRPILSHGILYLSNENSVQALRASDGKTLWAHPLETNRLASLDPTGQRMYIGAHTLTTNGGEQEYLYALNALNGTLLWKYRVTNLSFTGVAVEADGVVYFPANTSLYAVHVQNGRLLWQHKASLNAGFGTPVVVQHIIFVQSQIIFPHIGIVCPGEYEPSNALFALSATDGSLYWRSPPNAMGGTWATSLPLQVA